MLSRNGLKVRKLNKDFFLPNFLWNPPNKKRQNLQKSSNSNKVKKGLVQLALEPIFPFQVLPDPPLVAWGWGGGWGVII